MCQQLCAQWGAPVARKSDDKGTGAGQGLLAYKSPYSGSHNLDLDLDLKQYNYRHLKS